MNNPDSYHFWQNVFINVLITAEKAEEAKSRWIHAVQVHVGKKTFPYILEPIFLVPFSSSKVGVTLS